MLTVQTSPELDSAILWITAEDPCPALSDFVTTGLAYYAFDTQNK